MIELLRDPAWNGIAGIAAIIALIVAIWQEKRVIKILPRTLIVVGRALIGVLVILPGPSIQWTIQNLFAGGMPLILQEWQDVAIYYGLNTFALVSFAYAIFPGTVIASIASRKDKNTTLRANIAAIISLTITDITIIIVNSWGVRFNFGIPPFLYSLISNVIGGMILGTIIAYLVGLYDKVFETL